MATECEVDIICRSIISIISNWFWQIADILRCQVFIQTKFYGHSAKNGEYQYDVNGGVDLDDNESLCDGDDNDDDDDVIWFNAMHEGS